MEKKKWIWVAEEALKTKNVYATAKKWKITRGTVYKYIERFKKLKK